jgi:hypothetical protein
MLYARRRGALKGTYEITDDAGEPVTAWRPWAWRSGGEFELDGAVYTVRATGWGKREAEMADQRGGLLARAEGVGRKRWTVEAGGRVHEFERASLFRMDQVLVQGGRPVGGVRKTGMMRSGADADLPGLPLPVALFALTVVLMHWARADAASRSAGATGSS